MFGVDCALSSFVSGDNTGSSQWQGVQKCQPRCPPEPGACRGRGERGVGPGIQGQEGIQRVKLQKWKCCNLMIFPIVSLLIHAVWI